MKRRMNLRIFEGGAGGEGAGTGNGGQGGNAGNGGGSHTGNAGYTYEQAEEIASARAEKAERAALAAFFRKQGLSETEVTTAIGEFKANRDKNKPNVSAIEKERDDARKELSDLKNSNYLRDKGVKADDIDYVMFKVSKLVDDKTDFKKAAEKFLKENPRYAGGSSYRVQTSVGTNTDSSGGSKNASINEAIRAAIRR